MSPCKHCGLSWEIHHPTLEGKCPRGDGQVFTPDTSMSTDFTDKVLNIEAIKKLPHGFEILGHDKVKNPNALFPADPEIIEVLVVRVSRWNDSFGKESMKIRTSYFDFNGNYIGDL